MLSPFVSICVGFFELRVRASACASSRRSCAWAARSRSSRRAYRASAAPAARFPRRLCSHSPLTLSSFRGRRKPLRRPLWHAHSPIRRSENVISSVSVIIVIIRFGLYEYTLFVYCMVGKYSRIVLLFSNICIQLMICGVIFMYCTDFLL